jgi:iron complex outermembrane receptor protein
MSRLVRPLWAALPLCAAISAAWAQSAPASSDAPASSPSAAANADTTTVLPPVVVSAKKNPDQSTLTQPDLPTARRRIDHAAGGVGIVDSKDYLEGRVSTLADAVGRATGVFVQPRFGAEEARISIRGSGLQRTFHGRGLKLMQDGVPLNLADGSFDFQAVEALSARYVEVWRGANALQYGASNLGGAVNFVSPNGYNSNRVALRAEAGSFGYRRAQLSTGDVAGAFDYYVSTSAFRQDGFREHAKQDTRRNFANLGYQINPELETRFYLGRVDSESELPGSVTRAQLERDPSRANPGNVSLNQHRDIGWTRLSNKTVYRHGGEQLELLLYASEKHLHHPIFQVIEQQNRDYGMELRYTLEGRIDARRNRLTLGFAPSVGKTDEDRFLNVAGHPGARTNQTRQSARNLEFYAENEHHVLPDWALLTGLQVTRSKRDLDDRFVSGTGTDTQSESFGMAYHGVNPKLGVRWDAAPGLQFFSNLSRSSEPPTFSELAGGATPTLNGAQHGTTLEVGGRGQVAGLEWDVAVYQARLGNELLQVATNSIGTSVTVNAPHTVHRGLELGLRGQAFKSAHGQVDWRLNGLVNDFRFRNDSTYGDNPLPGIPRYAARAELGYRLGGGTRLAVNLEGAGSYPVDFANSFRARPYAVWGLKAGGPIGGGVSWFLDGRNLSNRHYAATTGVVRTANGADTAQFFPGDGRSLYAGIDWRFE